MTPADWLKLTALCVAFFAALLVALAATRPRR